MQLHTSDPDAHKWCCYLLHFPVSVNGCNHYVGITRTDRLRIRLKEHAAEKGGRFTTRMADANEHFILVKVWRNTNYAQERQIKIAGHYARQCWICNEKRARWPDVRVPSPDIRQQKAEMRDLLLSTSWARTIPK